MSSRPSSDADRARARRYYAAHTEECLARVQRHRARLNAIVDEARSVPCADCKRTFDPVCMDFHHVRGEKLFAVTHWRLVKLTPGMSKDEQLRTEIAKCEVVCACCHRLRHKGQIWKRKGNPMKEDT